MDDVLLLLTIIATTLGFRFAAERLEEFFDDGHDASEKKGRGGLMTKRGILVEKEG